MSNENEEESGEKWRREGEKAENETVTVKRRCDGFVSVEAFELFSEGVCGDLSWVSLRTCLIVNLRLGCVCWWCLMLLMCLFHLLLWSLSFVMVSPVARIGKKLYRSPLLSPKNVLTLVLLRRNG